jgi:hypothetical protein
MILIIFMSEIDLRQILKKLSGKLGNNSRVSKKLKILLVEKKRFFFLPLLSGLFSDI